MRRHGPYLLGHVRALEPWMVQIMRNAYCLSTFGTDSISADRLSHTSYNHLTKTSKYSVQLRLFHFVT